MTSIRRRLRIASLPHSGGGTNAQLHGKKSLPELLDTSYLAYKQQLLRDKFEDDAECRQEHIEAQRQALLSKINAHIAEQAASKKSPVPVSSMLLDTYELTAAQIAAVDEIEAKGKSFKKWV